MSDRVFINDVAARDGFQIEARWIETADKIAFIDRLSATGLAKIEATSFTSPKAIPNLADAADVMRGIRRAADVVYVALIPNAKGVERALDACTDELNFVMSASDSHGRANLRMTADQSLARFADMVRAAEGTSARLNASISTAFGCPFEGTVPAARVLEIVDRIEDLGIAGVTLCDTTGVANPLQVAALCEAVHERHPRIRLTLHPHNTRGMGLANALAAWQVGVRHFDAALGGLGGCPYAPGASGNICTEDLVHMFECMGVSTGVDLDALIATSETLPELIGHDVPGQVVKAGKADRRYPLPAAVAERQ
ncbi:hydroxymethylglutaryl-CoA lyase [Salinisphaera hydrothermalis]|uniref:Putative hydroxymethylglutaryl-CoA lyase n=1 Tax=Salinisphaera hydrothermalis (strain C41B8) TaxID=1304275 RepID=A0A084ING1_SALHC|nr:hydroxymethylglutaryl-CoA lyase [Salinisphaera hydrothermalis]KEZ78245.1 putative hydroxymethylglutaryl-CoA lyase [Salinisphaera hydrothermalis C41B8]